MKTKALVFLGMVAGAVGLAAQSNPLNGYAGTEYYSIPYVNAQGDPQTVFGTGSAAPDPRIKVEIAGGEHILPLDTGSRALYLSAPQLPAGLVPDGPDGQVYLNSSARIYLGKWSTQTITFLGATGTAAGNATATLPILVVSALTASSTPQPGTSIPGTTFSTLTASGSVNITNLEGAPAGTVPIQSGPGGGGTIFLQPGQVAPYSLNPGVLGNVENFGVGFDRTGQGTTPNNSQYNQQYNAFLNVSQMQAGTMHAGFLLTDDSVQLGLAANLGGGFGYTNLAPTGYATVPGSPPDWQAPTGNLVYDGAPTGDGQLVIDIGIATGILTLPGKSPSSTVLTPFSVNLLNSGGAISYDVNSNPENPLNPELSGGIPDVAFFDPLAGNFSENQPPLSGQFFNTGRNPLNVFDYLYDGQNGYIGLRPRTAIDPADNPGNVSFTAGFYPSPVPEPSAAGLVAAAFLCAVLWGRRTARRLAGSGRAAAACTCLMLLAASGGVSAEPYVIPIYNEGPTSGLRIYAAMGDGGTLVPYLLDTGSPQSFATYGTWWGNPPAEQTVQGANAFTFAAGITYYWNPISTTVTLGNIDGQPLVSTGAPVNVGYITNISSGGLTPQQSYEAWAADHAAGTPPLAGGTSYGNFGAGLYGNTTQDGNTSLATILAQIPLSPGLKKGFVINTGGITAAKGNLTIGLDTATIDGFFNAPGAVVLPMAKNMNGGSQVILPGGAKSYLATQLANATVSLNGSEYSASGVPVIFDTGGGEKVVFYQDQSGPAAVPPSLITGNATFGLVEPGTSFLLSAADTTSQPASFLGFDVLNSLFGQNYLDVDANLSSGIGGVRVNTGIQAFYDYEVLFDLDDGWIGLKPITPVPEPSAFWLAAGGLAAILTWRTAHKLSARRSLHAAAGILVALAAPLGAQEIACVPLQLTNIASGDSAPEYKLGIQIGFDSQPPKLYEFDTGAAGFFPAYLPGATPWWDGGMPTGHSITMNYTSGISYNASVTTTNLSLYAPGEATPRVSASGVAVGRINNTSGTLPDWDTDLQSGSAPLQGAFYGDFGMALYKNYGFPPTQSENSGLFAILPQLPGNLSSGFIVRTGGYGNATPELQIGIRPSDRAAFPFSVPMNQDGTVTFPVSGAPSYRPNSMNGTLTLEASGGPSQNLGSVPVILDTGATSTAIHEGSLLAVDPALRSGGSLAPGVQFSLSDGPWEFTQSEAGVPGLSNVTVSPGTTNIYAPQTGFVNSGITLFFQYNVMFDLEDGVVRFQPIPEPSGTALLAFAAAVAAAVAFRRIGRHPGAAVLSTLAEQSKRLASQEERARDQDAEGAGFGLLQGRCQIRKSGRRHGHKLLEEGWIGGARACDRDK